MMKLDMNKEMIKNVMAEHKITKLYHFTRIENLPSILQHGIIPVGQLAASDINYYNNDMLRLDGCKDASCLSISFPNYKMFYRLRKQDEKAAWVVLELDARILYELDCAFCYANAARGDVSALSVEERRSAAALANMFAERGHSREELTREYPTDPQAEVLAFAKIPPEFIKCVYVENTSVENTYIEEANVKCLVNDYYFAPRFDYKNWSRVA